MVQFLEIYLENIGGAAKLEKIVIEILLQCLLPAATHEQIIIFNQNFCGVPLKPVVKGGKITWTKPFTVY